MKLPTPDIQRELTEQHPGKLTPTSHAAMDIRLFGKHDLDQVPWHETEGSSEQTGLERNWARKLASSYERRCLVPFIEAGATAFVQNVETDFRLLKAGKHVFPVTINHTEYASSYVCSPYTHNISYAREELHNLDSKPLQWLCGRILDGLGLILKAGRINQTIHVNNWLLSTNLYPDWGGDGIAEITRYFVKHWPRHALVFRSINQCYEAAAYEKFRQAGYHFFLTRQVYVFDGKKPDYLKTKNFKWDLQLLQKSNYRWVRHDEIDDSDIPRILELYNDLYLKKYSYHNPQFTEKYLRLCLDEGLLTLHGLRNPEGRLDGIAGYFTRNGIITTPLVGYDSALPQKTGLYRMLMAIVLKSAAEEGLLLNLSAGAAEFKRHRGGVGYLEYSAVYLQHLPLYRQLPWRLLMGLMNTVGVAIMRAYKL